MLKRSVSVLAVIAGAIVLIVAIALYGGFIGTPASTAQPTPASSASATATPAPTLRPLHTPLRTPPPEPERTPIDTRVHGSAVVVPLRSADVAVPLSGIVRTIFVHANDQVLGGQLLLKLDQTRYLSDNEVAYAAVNQADAEVNRASVELAGLAPDATEVEVQAAQAQVRLAQADLDLAQAQLNAAQTALRQTELRAPMAGTVASVAVSVGESVTAGQTVVSIGDISALRIETTDVSELDVVRLAVGDRATIEFAALPDTSIGGIVDSIQVRGTSDSGEVTFVVTIKPDSYPPELRWNMSATVSIEPSG